MRVFSFGSIIVNVCPENNNLSVNNALIVKEINLVLEVYQVKQNHVVCIALGNTSELKLGMEVIFLSESVNVKFSKAIIGRVVDPMMNPIDGIPLSNNFSIHEIPTRNVSHSINGVDGSVKIISTGIKVIDMFCPYVLGGKIGILGGAGSGKTTIIMELIRNMRENEKSKVFTIFAGIGERVREGHAFYNELLEASLIDKENPSSSDIVIIFGNMDQNPSIRSRAAIASIAIAEYIRDIEKRNVLFLMDNIFRFSQAENEIHSSMGSIPSELGYQPSLFYDMSVLQEKIYSNTSDISITSVQAIYVPADDMQDPAVVAIMRHTDSSIVLDRELASRGIYPAIDPIASNSFVMTESFVGARHFKIYSQLKKILSRYKELETMINIIGLDNLSDEDKTIVHRSKLIYNFISQPFKVGEIFTGIEGKFVTMEDTITGFEKIANGELDNFSPDKLYFIGSINEII